MGRNASHSTLEVDEKEGDARSGGYDDYHGTSHSTLDPTSGYLRCVAVHRHEERKLLSSEKLGTITFRGDGLSLF